MSFRKYKKYGIALLIMTLFAMLEVVAEELIILDQTTAFRPVKNKIIGPLQLVTDEAAVIIDDPNNPSGVFHGVFYLKLKLNKSQVFGDVVVDFYVKKGGDDWRKAAELNPGKKPHSGDWILRYLWNAREPAFDWDQTQAFKDNLKIKFKLRNI